MNIPSPTPMPAPAPRTRRALTLAGFLATLSLIPSVSAASLYWDLNGATANTGTSATGAWDGVNTFWNTDPTGDAGGTTQAATTSTDDLFFSSGSVYTDGGTVTLTGTVSANSITFEEGPITLSGGTSLTLGGGGGSNPGLIFASGTGANIISTPVILGANSSFTQNSSSAQTIGAITGASGGFGFTVDGSGSGSVTVNGVIGTNVNGVTLNNANASLLLTGVNTYTGTTTLTAGTLRGSTTNVTDLLNAFGTSSIALNGGTLQLRANGSGNSKNIVTGNSATIGANAVTVDVNNNGANTNNSFTFTTLSLGTGQLNVTGGNAYLLRFSGATTLTGNATLNPTTGGLTFVGAVGDGGNGYSITKNGTGTLTMGSANTYSGGTTINQGTVTLATTTANLGTGAVAVNNTNTTGAGTAVVLNLNTISGTTLGSLSGTISTPTSGTNTVTINTGGTSLNLTVNQTVAGTYQGVIAGAGGLVTGTASTNALTLTGNNTYSGGTFVNGGTLIAGVGDTSTTVGVFGGSSRAVNVGATSGAVNGTLLIGGAFTVGNNITVRSGNTGTMTLGGSNTSGTSTYTGNVFLGTSAGKDVTLVSATGGSTEFSGVINETTGTANVIVGNGANLGTVKLGNAANAYGGVTTINGGTLEVAKLAAGAGTSSIGNSSAVATNLVINGGTLKFTGTTGNGSTDRLFTIGTNGATLDGSSSDNTALAFTGAGSLATTAGATDRTLTLTGTTSAGTLNSLASVVVDPTGGGKTLVTKSGSNTWVLNGVNTYTGTTAITGGTLALGASGSIGSSALIKISSGATFDVSALTYTMGASQTLRGAGNVTGAVIMAGTSTIAGGVDASTLGTLTFGSSLTSASGATFSLKLNSDSALSDAIIAAGITLNGATLSLTDLGATTLSGPATFTLFHSTSTSVSGTFAGLDEGASIIVGSNSYTISYLANGGTDITLTASAIPEPSTYAAILGGLTLAGVVYRRRSRIA